MSYADKSAGDEFSKAFVRPVAMLALIVSDKLIAEQQEQGSRLLDLPVASNKAASQLDFFICAGIFSSNARQGRSSHGVFRHDIA